MDLSKIVPSKEEREAFWLLQQARDKAEQAYDDAKDELPENDAHEDAITQAGRDRRDGKLTYEEFIKKRNELEKAEDARIDALPEIVALKVAYDAAEQAYQDHPCSGVLMDYDSDKPRRCAASGTILLEDDEVLEDTETSEYVLRCLILPPRPSEEEEEDDAESGDEPATAAA